MTGYIYQLFDLLPKANDHDTAKGWLFDYGFLQDVVKMAEKYGDPVSPAQAECVLFAGASILQQQIEGTPATPEPVEGDAPAAPDAAKRPYRVLKPASVAYWFALALIAEHNGRPDLRDRCLERTAAIAEEEKRHAT